MTNILRNLILMADSYKYSHFAQLPPNVKYMTAYVESRGGLYEHQIFFGLQYTLKEYLSRPINMKDVDEAESIITAHGEPFNRIGWERIVKECDGYMPLKIQALQEGSQVLPRVPLIQVTNTKPGFAWCVTFIETLILKVWYPHTVATISHNGRKIIKKYLEETGDVNLLPFKLHDFGFRGVGSNETAGIGGLAHLVNFMGTDTVWGLLFAREYYGAKEVVGFSIPAAEHSTITSWGKDREEDAYRNMIHQFSGPGKLVAVVSDSYDIWNAVDNLWGDKLKDDVIHYRGTVVIRPDSGDPVATPVEVVKRLGDKFGFQLNDKGYKVLPDYIRVIQGDGVNLKNIDTILSSLKVAGWSADNIAFGMGAELLQKCNRDTLKFAMKCNAVSEDGVNWIDISKSPVDDPSKASKAGRQAVVQIKKDGYVWLKGIQETDLNGQANMLETVWYNGWLFNQQNFEEIRNRATKDV